MSLKSYKWGVNSAFLIIIFIVMFETDVFLYCLALFFVVFSMLGPKPRGRAPSVEAKLT